jgi:hypothetical protein
MEPMDTVKRIFLTSLKASKEGWEDKADLEAPGFKIFSMKCSEAEEKEIEDPHKEEIRPV